MTPPHGAGAGVLKNELAEQESDPYLISFARAGDSNAFGKLYERHVGAARRLAQVLARDQSDADDLVAETFTRVLAAVRAGRGPDTAFRAYLLTTLRHALYDRARRERRVQYTDDLTPYERLSSTDDPVVKRLETSYAARAFARLPERWRAVLWHTEVEGETPAQVAPLLGLTANGVAALAYRARERLRQMYLQEHIDITDSPRCHWAGTHLAGYVRTQLARRDRSKVEDHLAGCIRCRSLHRELTEENSGLRGVLAALLLGTAAPAYLTASQMPGAGLAGWFGAIPACLALHWHHAADLAAVCAGTIAGIVFRLRHLPDRLIERFGPGNVIAAGGLVAASTAGVAAFASILISGNPIPLAPPRPAPHQPPAIAAPTAPAQLTPPPVLPAPPPSQPPPVSPAPPPSQPPPSSRPPATTPTSAVPRPAPFVVAPDPAQARLVAGETGSLPIALRAAESSAEAQILLGVRLPAGIHLAAGDAGEGWTCRDGETVACERSAASTSTVARIPVSVDADVTGFQSVPVTLDENETVLRVPVAPAGMSVGYAASGNVDFGVGGNALLACEPRPACLAADNNNQVMVPSMPAVLEPAVPPGLLDVVGGPTAASGARIAVPAGARVRWAGLAIDSSAKVAPPAAAVSGPGGGWYQVKGFQKNPTGQAFVDLTEVFGQAGGGDWWVAVPAGELPSGLGAYAGWSMAVVYDQPTVSDAEVAVYVGPRRLAEAQEVSVGLGEGGDIDVALVVWDGDRTLRDDSLTLDTQPVGDATNAAGGVNPSSLSCGLSPATCPWRTPGLDVLRHKGVTASSGQATLRSGQDPMTVGLLIVLAEG